MATGDCTTLSHEEVLRLVAYDSISGFFSDRDYGNTLGTPCGGGMGGEYIAISIRGFNTYAHRLAFFYMTGKWPTRHVDHINGVKRDNRWSNLREASMAQNKANEGKRSSNTSGWKGVSWHRAAGKWRAYIGATGEHLGLFDCPVAAHLAYLVEASKRYGAFSRNA